MQPRVELHTAEGDTPYKELYHGEHGEYRSAIGCLLYLACISRIDIAYAVSQVSQFSNKPTLEHWGAVKQIFRYLKGTKDYGIRIGSGKSGIEYPELFCSCDASFAGDPNCEISEKTGLLIGGRKSHTGYIFFYGMTPVSWKSTRQGRVSLSSTEAEVIALVSACKEAVFLREICEWISPGTVKRPTKIEQDNQSGIKLVNKKALGKRSRHYGKDYFFVTEKCEDDVIELIKQDTKEVLADALTKPMGPIDFFRLMKDIQFDQNGNGLDKGSKELTLAQLHFTKGVCWGYNKSRYKQAKEYIFVKDQHFRTDRENTRTILQG